MLLRRKMENIPFNMDESLRIMLEFRIWGQNEFDQEIPPSHIGDQPMAPQGRDTGTQADTLTKARLH